MDVENEGLRCGKPCFKCLKSMKASSYYETGLKHLNLLITGKESVYMNSSYPEFMKWTSLIVSLEVSTVTFRDIRTKLLAV